MDRSRGKSIIVLSVIFLVVFLTGCWDKVEIDERAFVLAMGIDHIHPQQQNMEIEEIETADHYRVTYYFPKQLIAFGGEAETANVTLSSIGENIYLTERHLSTRIHSDIFLGHLKAVVIGEEVAKNQQMFREVLDALEKDPLISRKISFAIVEGEAKDVLEIEPEMEPTTGQFLADLFRGRDLSARAPIFDLNDILISLHKNGNAAIPRVVATEDEIKRGGSAIIKDFELIGWLGERETIGLMIALNRVNMFNITVRDDGISIPFQATHTSSKYILEEIEEQLKLTIDIEVEGDIIQHYFNPKNDVLDPAFLEILEEKICENIKIMVEHTVDILQNKLKTDVLELDDYIRKFHPDIWRRVQDDWEEIFPTVEVEVVVDAKIRRVGLSR